MNITIPELSLVVLIGASGAGKSTFARAHFLPTETISSDYCRGLVSDDETDQSASKDAFEILNAIVSKRLARGRLTVVDATNVQPEARKPLIALAREYHALPVAIVFDLPEKLSQERNALRPDRAFGSHVVHRHLQSLKRSLPRLRDEGFSHVWKLSSPEEVDSVTIERQPLWSVRKEEHGPFDIIGDIHGCYDELVELLQKLGYAFGADGVAMPPEGRKAVFLGDLVDRGPKVAEVLRLVTRMTAAGNALCVPGNHDVKLLRALKGQRVTIAHGLQESLDQLAQESPEFRESVKNLLDSLISHFVLDDGKLVVAHAGMKESMQGRGSGKVRDFALFGETTGESDEFGLPVRYPWAADYRGRAMVVYGHTPVPIPQWLNNTINIDTGCVFGGSLTALRYPEKELVSVPAHRQYTAPARPFLPDSSPALSPQQTEDELLDLADFTGKRRIATALMGQVPIQEDEAATALEVMSRFAVNPKWLIYLPPTMSPSETSSRAGLLEHPDDAFTYFRDRGIQKVVCEQKHMGSRAIVIVGRDEAAIRRRFGIADEGVGICYTRTGRAFFEDKVLEGQLLERVQQAMTRSGLWDELETDWVALDCELMPWSLKAQTLVRDQYAAVGVAGEADLQAIRDELEKVPAVEALVPLAQQTRARLADMERYRQAYRQYIWPVRSIDDLKLAPFHLLASEGKVHADRNHEWQMQTLARLCDGSDPVLLATPYQIVDLEDDESRQTAVYWWEALTGAGGEGMVVKPLPFVPRNPGGKLIQPAVKCRGREYLRIIYGPEYTEEKNLTRLKERGLSGKRALALREFALGLEGLQRFVDNKPLRDVHECAFGVLALETEPIDPRL